MPSKAAPLPRTLGALRESSFSEARIGGRSVKDELRNNLICGLQRGEALFPGIVGYEDTVVPQLVNAVLSRHNFILLGLRGQAKTRLMRMLTALLDETIPYVEGCEIHDNPYRPICRRCRDLLAEQGDDTPIAWLRRDQRYVRPQCGTGDCRGRAFNHGDFSDSPQVGHQALLHSQGPSG